MTKASFEAFSNIAVVTAGVIYFLALLGLLWGRRGHDFARNIGQNLVWVALFAHLIGLVTRGLAADPIRVPWGNMYEFTIAATFAMLVWFMAFRRKFQLDWLTPWLVLTAIVFLMVAQNLLYQKVTPLQDSLHSPWLVIHVVAAVIATGAFTLAGILAAQALMVQAANPAKPGAPASRMVAAQSRLATKVSAKLAPANFQVANLEPQVFKLISFGFPIWTFAALITGPIWAKYAWGSYWNWDPKEVWAFITWVLYAAYLHARSTAGWEGRKSLILSLVALATLFFNFIGVNFFFGNSMHSYALAVLPTWAG